MYSFSIFQFKIVRDSFEYFSRRMSHLTKHKKIQYNIPAKAVKEIGSESLVQVESESLI